MNKFRKFMCYFLGFTIGLLVQDIFYKGAESGNIVGLIVMLLLASINLKEDYF